MMIGGDRSVHCCCCRSNSSGVVVHVIERVGEEEGQEEAQVDNVEHLGQLVWYGLCTVRVLLHLILQ